MSKIAAAYSRRSGDKDDPTKPGGSYDAQEASARRLAAAFAPDAELVEFKDEGISGRKADRKAYAQLKRDIAAGVVCCVFAYSLSRLGRDTGELLEFFKLCQQQGVMVMTEAEGKLSATDGQGTFLLTILAAVAQLESDLGKERTKWARAERERRYAEKDLPVPASRPLFGMRKVRRDDNLFELVDDPDQIAPVLDAWRDAQAAGKGIRGTAALLNERNIPAPEGGPTWGISTTRRVLVAHGAYVPTDHINAAGHSRPGRNIKARYAGLLLCGCERTMTPNTVRGQYYCAGGLAKAKRLDGSAHGRYSVTERALRAALDPIAATYVGGDEVRAALPAPDAATRARLMARMTAVGERFEAGELGKPAYAQKIASLQAEIAKLDRRENVLQSILDDLAASHPPDPESADGATLNAHYRRLWQSVQPGVSRDRRRLVAIGGGDDGRAGRRPAR